MVKIDSNGDKSLSVIALRPSDSTSSLQLFVN